MRSAAPHREISPHSDMAALPQQGGAPLAPLMWLSDIPASAKKRKSYIAPLESMKDLSDQENGKLALLTSGRPAFQQHVKRAEGSDTTPRLAHAESPERRMYKPQFRQKRKRSRSPAGPRRLGTATRISASLSRRLSASFWRTPGQDPKAAKFAVLIPGHAGFPNRVKRPESSDTPPTSHVQKVLRTG